MKRLISNSLGRVRTLAAPAAAAFALAAFAGVVPSPAQAEYNGPYYLGCTYSWGSACVSPYQHAESVRAMDPDNAYFDYPGVSTSNGYPKPKVDGVERNVCASVFSVPNQTLSYGWACAYGVAVIAPHQWGYPGLGTGVPYYSIALYERTN